MMAAVAIIMKTVTAIIRIVKLAISGSTHRLLLPHDGRLRMNSGMTNKAPPFERLS